MFLFFLHAVVVVVVVGEAAVDVAVDDDVEPVVALVALELAESL